jgi:hypothetical protein
MPPLNTSLFDRVIAVLVPFMETEDEPRAVVLPVVSQRSVRREIAWEGTPKQFIVALVEVLSHDELRKVLERLPVGEEQRSAIADVCKLIDEEATSWKTILTAPFAKRNSMIGAATPAIVVVIVRAGSNRDLQGRER